MENEPIIKGLSKELLRIRRMNKRPAEDSKEVLEGILTKQENIERSLSTIESAILQQNEWFRRSNPIEGDDVINEWAEEVVPGGFLVQFILDVPEGWIFYWDRLGMTFQSDTTYRILIDGIFNPSLTDTLQDFGDFAKVFLPPKLTYNQAIIEASNTGSTTKTYSTFFGGFTRRTQMGI